MPILSALRSAFRARSFRIGVALDWLAAIGARRLAETYYALDNEPYSDSLTDDEAEHNRHAVTAGLRSAATAFQTEERAPGLRSLRTPIMSKRRAFRLGQKADGSN